MGGLCFTHVGLRKFLKGCGIPNVDKSRGSWAEGRGREIAKDWLDLAGSPPSCFSSPEWEPFPLGCLPGFQAGEFYSSPQLQRALYL